VRSRRASGVREGDLIRRAKALRQSVDSLLPTLTPECETDRFDRLRGALEKVREAKDDAKQLERMSRWGDPMARSYAGLLKFQLDPPETPGMLVARFPMGDIPFAPLARSPKEVEIAVQESDDPHRLLLGYLGWARKGYHFFATNTTLYCTGRSPKPPAEFVRSQLAILPYRLTEDPAHHRYECGHLRAGEARPYVEVDWIGAGSAVRVCRKCTKEDRQLLASLTDGIAVPKPDRAFPATASLNVHCHGGPNCVHQQLPDPSRGIRKRYLFGRLSDAQFIDAYRSEVKPRLEATRTPTFVAGGVCYGGELEKFLDALGPTVVERKALEEVLGQRDGLFEIDEPSASRALEKLWHDHAETIVAAIVPDPEAAQRLVREAKAAPGRIAEILKRAQKQNVDRAVLDALPRYTHLVPEAAYVDRIARTYRTQGGAAAEKQLIQTLPKEGKERGLAFGLLAALGRESAHAWQFTDTEREFGSALAAKSRDVLNGPAESYHDALGRLFAVAGVTDWGVEAPSPPAS
jgi:hypothetical protein